MQEVDHVQRASPRPNLEHLKTQAKELLEAFTRSERGALERVRVALPVASAGAPPKAFALHDAQSAIAREYGFESWAALRREVARRRPPHRSCCALMRMPLPPQVETSLLSAAGAPGKPVPQLPEQLPLVAVRNAVILVGSVVPLCLGRARSLAALDAALADGTNLLGLFAQTRDDIEDPAPGDLFEVGCAAQVIAVHRDAEPGVWVVLRALQSLRFTALSNAGAFTNARVVLRARAPPLPAAPRPARPASVP